MASSSGGKISKTICYILKPLLNNTREIPSHTSTVYEPEDWHNRIFVRNKGWRRYATWGKQTLSLHTKEVGILGTTTWGNQFTGNQVTFYIKKLQTYANERTRTSFGLNYLLALSLIITIQVNHIYSHARMGDLSREYHRKSLGNICFYSRRNHENCTNISDFHIGLSWRKSKENQFSLKSYIIDLLNMHTSIHLNILHLHS